MGRPSWLTRFLLVLFLYSLPLRAETAPFNVVLDIHDTLVHTSLADEGSLSSPLMTWPDGSKQHLAYGVSEFLLAAAKLGAHVSVYSSGKPEGVEPVLSQIKVPGGKTAFDVVRESGGRILYRNDLFATNAASAYSYELEGQGEVLEANPELGEALQSEDRRIGFGGMKKVLARHFGPDLSRTFLLDDNSSYVARGEEKNYIYMPWGSAQADLDGAVDAGIKEGKIYADAIRGDIAQRNRLVYALGLIKLAVDEANRTGGSAVEAMHRQGAYFGLMGEVPREDNMKILAAGLRLMREQNPGFRLQRLHFTSFDCRLKFAELAKEE